MAKVSATVCNVEQSRTSFHVCTCAPNWRNLRWPQVADQLWPRARMSRLSSWSPRRQCDIINHFCALQAVHRRSNFPPPTLHSPARTCSCHFSAQRPRCRDVPIANSTIHGLHKAVHNKEDALGKWHPHEKCCRQSDKDWKLPSRRRVNKTLCIAVYYGHTSKNHVHEWQLICQVKCHIVNLLHVCCTTLPCDQTLKLLSFI